MTRARLKPIAVRWRGFRKLKISILNHLATGDSNEYQQRRFLWRIRRGDSNEHQQHRFLWLVGWLCWGLTSQSTIFQSCRDGAIASWVINQYFRGVKCLAQGHNTAEVGLEPRTSRSGVRHSTTEPPRSPLGFYGELGKAIIMATNNIGFYGELSKAIIMSTNNIGFLWRTQQGDHNEYKQHRFLWRTQQGDHNEYQQHRFLWRTQQGDYNEYQQHRFLWRTIENYPLIIIKIPSSSILLKP